MLILGLVATSAHADNFFGMECPGQWVSQGFAMTCQCPDGSMADMQNDGSIACPMNQIVTPQSQTAGVAAAIAGAMERLGSLLRPPPDLTPGIPLSAALNANNRSSPEIECNTTACMRARDAMLDNTPPPRKTLPPGANPFSGKTEADYARDREQAYRNFQQSAQPPSSQTSQQPRNSSTTPRRASASEMQAGCGGTIQAAPPGLGLYDSCAGSGGTTSTAPDGRAICSKPGITYYQDGTWCNAR
jgi:hypothetical protein